MNEELQKAVDYVLSHYAKYELKKARADRVDQQRTSKFQMEHFGIVFDGQYNLNLPFVQGVL